MAEAKLCEELGVEVIWLAEHHFNGNCAYVDPTTFAAAILAATQRIKVGFAVAQVSLHHPVRLAEQIALLDNLGEGRLIVGLGRGTAYNIYEYQGYGIDWQEAHDRYAEAEAIMLKAWTSPAGFSHQGRFWDIRAPRLRPACFTRPHPAVLRAASSEAGALQLAERGLPFLMNVQSLEVTRQRLAAYRARLAESGHGRGRRSPAAWKRAGSGAMWWWPRPMRRPPASASPPSRRCRSSAAPCANGSMPNRASAWCRKRCRRPAPGGARADPRLSGHGGGEDGGDRPHRGRRGDLFLPARPMPAEVANASIRLFMTRVAPEFRPRQAAAE